MTLERRLQIDLAIMTSLGSLLLAIAEQEPRLAILAVVISGTSVYFADVKGWIVLNSLWSNVAGVAALGLTLWHWHSLESELLFIALANFLTYLQCVLHYRAKAQHVYGMLMLLSFLQMAVASVLASTLVFGCVLIAYLWAMLRTFALFSIFREQEEATRGPVRRLADTLTLAEFFVTPVHQLVGMLWRGQRGDNADAGCPVAVVRWPLASRPSQLVRRRQAGDDQVAVNGIGWQMAKFGLLTLPLTAAVFVAIPRAGQQRDSSGPGGVALTGFSELVTLQDVTRIQENPEEVMRIRLSDYQTGRPYELSEQPWLRGSALGRYGWGSWKPEEWPGVRLVSLDEAVPPARDALPDPGENDLVRFEVTLEPIRTSTVVFTLEPAHRVPGPAPSNLRREGATHEHYRPRNRRRTIFSYEMLTTGLKNGRQVPFRAQDEPYAQEQKTELLQPFAPLAGAPKGPREGGRAARGFERREEATGAQRERLQGLASEAAKVLQRAGLDAGQNPREAALALERFLQSEGGFTYSLNPPPAKQGLAEADPVNQFVVEVKKGHCEYFASALALMLRSQGIPSRMVVGYKGGTWNAVGGYYEVRQQEAHAWVEAWIFEGDRPLGWLRLDPTPEDAMAVLPTSSRWAQLSNYLTYLWSRYVLGMDANLQEDLFQPWAALFQRDAWRRVCNWLWKTVLGQSGDSGIAFSWRLAAFAVGVPMALIAFYRLMRRLVKRIRASRSRQPQRRGSVPRIDFYVRLERLLARCGLSRRESQTPREFAAASAGALAAGSLTMAAAPLLPSIVEAYYRVRFGGPPLSEEERERLSDELTRLEAIVFESHGGGRA